MMVNPIRTSLTALLATFMLSQPLVADDGTESYSSIDTSVSEEIAQSYEIRSVKEIFDSISENTVYLNEMTLNDYILQNDDDPKVAIYFAYNSSLGDGNNLVALQNQFMAGVISTVLSGSNLSASECKVYVDIQSDRDSFYCGVYSIDDDVLDKIGDQFLPMNIVRADFRWLSEQDSPSMQTMILNNQTDILEKYLSSCFSNH